MNKMAAIMMLILAGCAPLSKRQMDTADESVLADSCYVYGSAIIGEQSELRMGFRNVLTNERKSYSKNWADNRIYKEHIFVLALPEGNWEFLELNTRGGAHGGYSHAVGLKFEIRKGFGTYLGKFETRRNPMNDLRVESARAGEIKKEIDLYLKEKYGRFRADKTIPASFRQ
jgi:hypothetical protein